MDRLIGIMNMVPTMNRNAFHNTQNEVVAKSYLSVVERSMKNAAAQLSNTSSDVAISGDGAWQKRGFSSLNGFVSVVSVDSGKCLDYRVKTKKCTACDTWDKKKDSVDYNEFIDKHDCPTNHTGSSGSMEAAALIEIFSTSEAFNGIRYIEYLGGGDMKSHHDIMAADPYPGMTVKKLECVGHVQKRVGNRLRALKNSYKGRKDDEAKVVKKLTHKQINKLQNYYGIALFGS